MKCSEYFETIDIFIEEGEDLEKERKKIKSIPTGVTEPSKLQGETEREKIMSMQKPSIRTIKKQRK